MIDFWEKMLENNEKKSRRSNQEWLEQLGGQQGSEKQYTAYQSLARYLYIVVYNYLKARQGEGSPSVLLDFALEELETLAQDFVQETLGKLAFEEAKLLRQFKGCGSFTSWAAQIVCRQAGHELRRPYWMKRQTSPSPNGSNPIPETFFESLPAQDLSPEEVVLQWETAEILQRGLAQLKEPQRVALYGYVVEKREIQDIARMLNTTDNAVYILIHRAKRVLQQYLQRHLDLISEARPVF